jgi:hypothetical protein
MVGGHGRGRKHRNWYYATGVPGYGRGRGCYWPGPPELIYPEPSPGGWVLWGGIPPELSPREELRMLEEEEEDLTDELEEVRTRLEELRKELDKEVK